VLVQTINAATDILVNADIVSGGGALSVLAGRSVIFADQADLRAAATGTVQIVAGMGSITQADRSLIASGSGNISLTAAQNVTLGGVSTSGNVELSATAGSVLDGGDSQVDVVAGGLKLSAALGIGTLGLGANAIETTVGVLSARAGSGGINLLESDALTLGVVQVTVQRVDVGGAGTSRVGVAQSDLVTSGNGNIVLRTVNGSITLTDGGNGDGLAVRADGSGEVSIDVGGASSSVVSTGGGAGIASGSGQITVHALGDIKVDKVYTQGQTGLSSETGGTDITQPLDAQGKDLNLVGNTINISAPVSSVGATLSFRPFDPTRDIAIGDESLPTVYPDSMFLGQSDLAKLMPGFKTIVFGSGLAPDQGIFIVADEQPVRFADPVLLDARGAGSAIVLQGELSAASLTILGSGSTTHATNARLLMDAGVNVDDALKIDGTLRIVANQKGAAGGDIVLRRAVNAQTGTALAVDALVIDGNGGNVEFDGAIGAIAALSSLHIEDALNVSFQQSVHVAGELYVQASGKVSFDDLVLLDGGTLHIVGASQVVLHGVTLGQDGDLVISANALQLLGVVQGSGAANASLTTATQGGAISVGASNAAGALNLSPELLDKLQGFAQVMIGTVAADGHAAVNAGPVTLNSAALSHVVAGSLAVFGRDIAVSGQGPVLPVAHNLTIDASGGIDMAAGSALTTGGADISLQARADLVVATLEVRSATVSGTVSLSSAAGVIRDADADNAVNVRAAEVVMRGNGPLYQAGSQAAVVEVDAARVNVDAARGIVLRDGGANGSSMFTLVDDATVRQQLVVTTGLTPRGTAAPAVLQASTVNSADLAAWLSALMPKAGGLGSAHSMGISSLRSQADEYLDHAGAGLDLALTLPGLSSIDNELLSSPSAGLTGRLTCAYLLGAKSMQPMISGLQRVGSGGFDYWEESLAI
jgi:hypothetical protein